MSQKFIPSTKHSSPWIVLLLGVITFGIYSYVWVSLRYDESTAKPEKMSHWVVPIAIIISAVLLSVALMIFTPIMVESVEVAAAVSVYGNYGLLYAAQLLAAWWTVHFARRLNSIHAITIRPPYLWILAIFFSPILVWYLQRQMNGRSANESFFLRVITASVAVLLGLTTVVTTHVFYPVNREIESLEIEYRETREYISCHQELEAAYPNQELSDQEYEDYMDGFDDCEALADF